MLGWILIIGGGLLVVLLLWKKIKAHLPWSTPGVIDTAASVATQATAETALESLVLLAWANSDVDTITQLATIRTKIRAWVPTPTTPTVQSLQSELAALKAKIGG